MWPSLSQWWQRICVRALSYCSGFSSPLRSGWVHHICSISGPLLAVRVLPQLPRPVLCRFLSCSRLWSAIHSARAHWASKMLAVADWRRLGDLPERRIPVCGHSHHQTAWPASSDQPGRFHHASRRSVNCLQAMKRSVSKAAYSTCLTSSRPVSSPSCWYVA